MLLALAAAAAAQRDCYGAMVRAAPSWCYLASVCMRCLIGITHAPPHLLYAASPSPDLPSSLSFSIHPQLEVAVQQAGEAPGQAQPLQTFYGYPGPFGAFSLGLLNDTATLPAPLALASPLNACGTVAAPPAAGAAAVVARGNCSFADKAWALQKAGWGAMLLFNNEEGAAHSAV